MFILHRQEAVLIPSAPLGGGSPADIVQIFCFRPKYPIISAYPIITYIPQKIKAFSFVIKDIFLVISPIILYI